MGLDRDVRRGRPVAGALGVRVYGLVVRAVVLNEAGGPEVLRLEEVPDPQAGEGEVLVRVEAVGINHADLTRRAGAETFPTILGYDAAGRR
jgi:NADPH:quinone reductase